MQKAYIYPISSRAAKDLHNPYLEHFMGSLKEKFHFLNSDKPSNKGIADILKYLGEADTVFLHWPENIVDRKFGLFQAILLTVMIPVFRLRKISIVYVVHNKLSHSEKRRRIKSFIARSLIQHSNFLVTHAREGVDFIQTFSRKPKRVFFFPHPIDKPPAQLIREKDIDVLIWGNIAPYKGVHNFLLSLNKEVNHRPWNILIAGKVSSDEYYQELLQIQPEGVSLLNEFIDDDQLHDLISRSRIVLFPYHQDSILSSGAFAKSQAYPVVIIGPNCGAFKDFQDLDQVYTFDSFQEIKTLIHKQLQHHNEVNPLESEKIASQYSWENFGKAFGEFLRHA